ncbi:MAG: hypothetical protein M1281_00770 [Chloroflexi bacterium]|nr:hypothetical protein [Chloroflexota bacterium]
MSMLGEGIAPRNCIRRASRVGRWNKTIGSTGLPPGMPWPVRVLFQTFRLWIDAVYRNRYLQVNPASSEQITAWQLLLMAARLREVEAYPKEYKLLMERMYEIVSPEKIDGF